MSKRKIDTIQYNLFFSDLNAALKLAYVVRAIRLKWCDRLEELEEIELQLRKAWVNKGFTEAEVKHNGLTDLSWDLRQLGWSERRSPNEVYERSVLKKIKDSIEPISDSIFSGFDPSRYPFAKRHRFADLVNSINVERTLHKFIEKSSLLGDDPDFWGEHSGTPLEKFILLRRPIPVVPGAYQNQRAESFSTPHIGILVELDMSAQDIEAAIDDFRYHIAEAQSQQRIASDFTSNTLIEWAKGSMQIANQDSPIVVFTQIIPVLAGLQAYDTMEKMGGSQKRGARAQATKATAELFRQDDPRRDPHKIGQWLDAERKKIEKLVERFNPTMESA
ncbi:hypothetical protein [Comamonas thiooxydans]|uniref:hypothetical protein n=1 Tax=Comamonas thiooxydans TaxID=363952 RepID=UPI0005104A46|nr:hypothetical protein [Comamonas thiooxydans]KGG96077.1 hypothetical protein P369_02325 [Comamonas thiooxydans]KGH02517.1 hypothetical protein P367_02330 [Comamonas thiooxydans]KGH09732.1 hypothetical protein P365_02335 [Comamonas thiooxydans]KGH16183.1 hypothetical protein P368_02335 [Comamonas thiooxydans]TZG10194.1 hypothetical protein FZC30_09090 [Comamonas thiooxydans]